MPTPIGARTNSKTEEPKAADGALTYSERQLFNMNDKFVAAMRKAHPKRETPLKP